jgi:signal transduction histidine kinase/CheY-like chemotaxis protein
MRLRWYLSGLVLAAIVPLALLAAVVTVALVRQQEVAVENGLLDAVDARATAVDNELDTSIKSLETLATSPRLDHDDVPGFYEVAVRAGHLHRWSSIALVDLTGQALFNTARPLGATLPNLADREYFQQVTRTGRLYVSDLLRGRTVPSLDVIVAIPVVRGGRLKYVLIAGLDPMRLADVFATRTLPARAFAFVVGRDGVVIARSPDHARFVGEPLAADVLARLRVASSGRFREPTAEGVDVESAYVRMERTGWTVAYGRSADLLYAPVRRIAWTGGIVAGTFVAIALALALLMARRLAADVQRLGGAASALGRGEPLGPAERLGMVELREMRAYLAAADQLLRARAEERTRSLEAEREARVAAEVAAATLRASDARLRRLIAEAEATGRAKDEFLAMLSHELRNPIAAISTAVQVLDAVGKVDDTAQSAREVIARQVHHLSQLVDDLLDVGRATTGKIALRREAVDLADIATRQLNVLRASGGAAHDVALQARSVWVSGDETRLAQVVNNLLSNAFKYTPAGGTIRVTVAPEGDEAVVRVTDDGIGIEGELQSRIFDLFVQGRQELDRSQGGLGIGLTLVRRLVEMHGGTVTAASEGRNRGSTFTVRLPAIAAPAEARPALAASPGAGRRRILVVEDNADSRDMLRVLLTLAGHEVHEAEDGPAAIAAAAAFDPDIALVDLGLPGADGYAVARAIRASASGQGIALVALTGYGSRENRERALADGFDAYLVKPVDPERLTEVLATLRRPSQSSS